MGVEQVRHRLREVQDERVRSSYIDRRNVEQRLVERALVLCGNVSFEPRLDGCGSERSAVGELKTRADLDVNGGCIRNGDFRGQIRHIRAGGCLTQEARIDWPVIGKVASRDGEQRRIELDRANGRAGQEIGSNGKHTSTAASQRTAEPVKDITT